MKAMKARATKSPRHAVSAPAVPVPETVAPIDAVTRIKALKRELEALGASTLPPELLRRLEDLSYSTTPKLALLMRWSEAESLVDRDDTSPNLERLAWRGMEMLCHDVLHDVETILRVAGLQEGGFATLPHEDEDGGAV